MQCRQPQGELIFTFWYVYFLRIIVKNQADNDCLLLKFFEGYKLLFRMKSSRGSNGDIRTRPLAFQIIQFPGEFTYISKVVPKIVRHQPR